MSYILRLHTSYVCTNRCSYCHVFVNWNDHKDKPKFMSPETADKALRSITEVIKRSGYSIKPVISLYGGEPLTNRKLISHVLTTDYGLEFGWILNTNGTLITEESADLFKRKNVDVHLSLDGPKEENNYNRLTKQGKPSFQKALNGLRILSEKECLIQLEPCLVENVSIFDIVDMASNYKCRSVYLAFADGFIKSVDVMSLAERVADGLKYAHSKGIVLSGPWFRAVFGTNLRYLPNVIVDTDGSVYDFTMTNKVCDVEGLEDFYFSDKYYFMNLEHRKMRLSCVRSCPIYSTCGGYLKSMVVYHTKSIDNYNKECSIAVAISRELKYRGEYYGPLRIAYGVKFSRAGNLVFLTKNNSSFILKNSDISSNGRIGYTDPKTKMDMLKSGVVVRSISSYNRHKIVKLQSDLKGSILKEESNYVIVSNNRNLKTYDKYDLISKSIHKILRFLGYLDLGNKKIIICVTDDLSGFWHLGGKMPSWVSAFVSDEVLFCTTESFYSFLSNNERSLVHELCHTIFSLKNIKLPWWFAEGLCDYIAGYYTSEVNRLYDIADVVKFKSVLEADPSPKPVNRVYATLQSFVDFVFNRLGSYKVISMIRSSSKDIETIPNLLDQAWREVCADNGIEIIPLRFGIERGSGLRSLRLNITRMCNMRCSYCFSVHDKVKMSESMVCRSVDLFMDTLRMNGIKKGMIRFFGGEPLLFFDLIKSAIFKANNLASSYGVKLSYVLNTNGTIISDDIVNVLERNNVELSISLDGIREVHDSKRKMVSGKGSFDIIDRNIDKFLESGCRVYLDCTVSSHNYDKLNDLIYYVRDKNLKHHPNFIKSISFNDVYVTPDNADYDSVVEGIAGAYKLGKELGVKVKGVAFFTLEKFIRMCDSGLNNFKFCMGSGNEICVDPDGKLYSCGVSRFLLGDFSEWFNVFSKDEYKSLYYRTAGSIPSCRGCEIEFLCCGGCVADSYRNTGDLYSLPSNCEFHRKMFSKLRKEVCS